jgi:hypothetical protein
MLSETEEEEFFKTFKLIVIPVVGMLSLVFAF